MGFYRDSSGMFTVSPPICSLSRILCKIQLNPDIQGIMVERIQYKKVLTYANNMLFSLANPTISLPNLFKEIEIYSSLSYFKINLSKSEAMGVAVPNALLKPLKLNYKFKGTDQALKYLGTSILVDLSQAYELNLLPLLHEVRTLGGMA